MKSKRELELIWLTLYILFFVLAYCFVVIFIDGLILCLRGGEWTSMTIGEAFIKAEVNMNALKFIGGFLMLIPYTILQGIILGFLLNYMGKIEQEYFKRFVK